MLWGGTIPEMLSRCVQPLHDSIREASASGMTVLDSQQAHLKWQNHQQFSLQQRQSDNTINGAGPCVHDSGFPVVSDPQLPPSDDDKTWLDAIPCSMLPAADPPFGNHRLDAGIGLQSIDLLGCLGSVIPCSSLTGIEVPCDAPVSITGNSSFKKRKADCSNETPAVTCEVAKTAAADANSAQKRIKSGSNRIVVKSKQESHQNPTSSGSITAQSRKETCTEDSTKHASSKASGVVQKPDYIHVRARRGQATDSHSLAERVRREKISERMKYLQHLVPGCDKVTGKAGMLDEIINYVQSLQKQVEFLSMKLAAVNPIFDTSPDCLSMSKENVCDDAILLGMGSVAPQLLDPTYFTINQLSHMATCGIDPALNLPDEAAVLNSSATVTQPPLNVFGNTAFNQLLAISPGWNADLQCLLNGKIRQAKATLCPPFSGMGANNILMRM